MNRKDQEIKQQSCAYLEFDKGGKNIYWKKAYLTNGAGKLDIYLQKNQIRFISFTLYKDQFKLDQTLNLKHQMMKLKKKKP